MHAFDPIPPTARTARPFSGAQSADVLIGLRQYYQFVGDVRQGICLLNAGQFEKAAARFSQAAEHGFQHASLAAWLAACHVGLGHPEKAVAAFDEALRHRATEETSIIRRALAYRAAGQFDRSIETLREAVRETPNHAELQFQFGISLAETERYDEAEQRFIQAVHLDPEHTEALVSLGLCCAIRGAPGAAARHLQAAQKQRPWDARIAVLYSQAAQAAVQLGQPIRVRGTMPETRGETESVETEVLLRVIEQEPEFMDVFLSLPAGQVNREEYTLLLRALESALENHPEHAELLHHCGRVLDRLGDREAAIAAHERAVRANPKYVRALLELAELYKKSARAADAAFQLERAVEAGAAYADVYFLLGNLYRDQGNVPGARDAYGRALKINSEYGAAQQALVSLPE